MTLTKLALAVLGTIGLTAGTVLAVAEPTSKPIPAVAQAVAGSCPGAACSKSGCTNSACAVSTAANIEAKCAVCPVAARQTEPIAAEIDTIGGPVPAGFVDLDVNSNSGDTGRVVFAAVSDSKQCPATACSVTNCANSGCEAGACNEAACKSENCPASAQKHTRRLTLGIGLSAGGPIIHVATGPNDDAACETCPQGGCSAASLAGNVFSSLSGSTTESNCNETACEASQSIAATACDAKPISADHAFPICTASTCAEANRCEDACHDEAAEVAASCARCDCCTCEDCECASAEKVAKEETSADRSPTKLHTFNINGRRVTIGTRVQHENGDRLFFSEIQATTSLGDYPPLPIPRLQTLPHEWASELNREELERSTNEPKPLTQMGRIVENVPPVICPGESDSIARNYDSYRLDPHANGEATGRVHVTHIASGELHPPINVPYFSPGEFPSGQRIRLSGFAAPVAAPLPARALAGRHEGTWSRTVGDSTATFTLGDGRVNGRWQITSGIDVRFSGTCTATKDDQFVGVIDEIEAHGEDSGEAFSKHVLAQRLVDQPFAARFVVDGQSLIIKDIRCAGLSPKIDDNQPSSGDMLRQLAAFGCGRFERGGE